MFFFFWTCKLRVLFGLFGFPCIVVWLLLQHCYWTLFSALFILSHDFLMLVFFFLVTIQLLFRSFYLLLVDSSCCWSIFPIGVQLLLLLYYSHCYWLTFLVVILFFYCAIHFFLCYSFPLVANCLFLLCSSTLVVIWLLLSLPGSSFYYLIFFMLVDSFC
jgi:hypothetical protein